MRGGDVAVQREVLAALIELVVPVRSSRGKYTADVTWAPLGEALRTAVNSQLSPAASRAA
jgi:hypothetical protein